MEESRGKLITRSLELEDPRLTGRVAISILPYIPQSIPTRSLK
jgi:hypothetical protein